MNTFARQVLLFSRYKNEVNEVETRIQQRLITYELRIKVYK